MAEINRIALEKDYNHLQDYSQNAHKREQLFRLDLQEMETDRKRLIDRKAEIEKSIEQWEDVNKNANAKITELQKQIETENAVLNDWQKIYRD